MRNAAAFSRTRLRPLATPRGVEVRTDGAGEPVALRVPEPRRRSAGTFLRVEVILERWRIDDEWWRAPVSRLYYEVALEGGGTRVVYRDLISGGWHLQ